MILFLIALWGSSDGSGGVPITPPPPSAGDQPVWLTSPVVVHNNKLVALKEEEG